MSDTVSVMIEMDLRTHAVRLQAPQDPILVFGMLEAARGIVHGRMRHGPAAGLTVVEGPAALRLAEDAKVRQ